MNYKIVSVSKNDNISMTGLDSLQIENTAIEHVVIKNNTENLTVIYNRILNDERNTHKSDYIIFIHGDASVDIPSLVKKIEENSSKYDIMGLCGCEKIIYTYPRLNWFAGSNQVPNSRYGMVTHITQEMIQQINYNQMNPNIKDHSVICIDGVCIIFTKKAIDSGILFNEDLAFDHYDTDISFEAVINKKLRLGVIVEPSLTHYSIGESITEDKFIESENIFRAKWDKILGVDSAKLQMEAMENATKQVMQNVETNKNN